MSTTGFTSTSHSISAFPVSSPGTSSGPRSSHSRSSHSGDRSHTRQTSATAHPEDQLTCLIDLQSNPFRNAAGGANPLPEFLSDEIYQMLRANDIINEKGLRDFIIRKMFRQMKDEHSIATAEAINRIKELYPYIQLDTIRKIVYRVYPTSQRKMMI